ncbi:caa -type subunit iv : Caa(3)-type oxidase subunit IV OS=Marinobacter nanhaiticus D15-8W GN=J057_16645 PE=4 SV=1: COX4_pro [Gemmata massiliana]|uniref:Oxidase n=1 Tax=Gemmata massiliana TaxID=1210884 RepID=A0A6P2CW14_9BACT|nr:cytochrome C oxidase subunit IV family protein [Gemmata massiliana]VTR92355.1 caa -type subunit iv : Caa(3)-type oxidase subunit IV OS=Marinobacter nanhaiticus D15-8W GN=J057_16645 PE=4 SV=1: COX4_pro [Gemmata massiliana]
MANPTTHGTTTSDDPHGIRASADSPGLLLAVFACIIGLALANIGISMQVGPTKFMLPLQLAIGSIQAGLVAYYFMHLRQGDKVVILTALSSLFWMGILFVLFMGDYMTRHLVVGS